MKDYDRVSLSPPLAKALHDHIQSINSGLTLKEVVTQACMEYLERRKGTVYTTSDSIQDTVRVEKKTKKIPQKNDLLGFSDFLDD